MGQVLAAAPAGSSRPLTFARDGAGTLFYTTRLRYASDELFQQGLDNGIRIERSFAPYVENGARPAATSYKAGDLIRVTLTLRLTKERRFVAVTDPLPAGFEPLESWFATTARSIGSSEPDRDDTGSSWESWWQRGGFDHVRAPRRSRPAVRDAAGRGPPHLHLRRARHHCRHVPDRAGARGGDVRAGNLRPDADGGDHGAAMRGNWIFRLKPEATTDSSLPRRSAKREGGWLPALAGRRRRAVLLLGATALAAVWLRCGPLPAGLLDSATPQSTVVVDRNGTPLYEALAGGGIRSLRLDAGHDSGDGRSRDRRRGGSPLLAPPRRRSRRHRARAATEHRRTAASSREDRRSRSRWRSCSSTGRRRIAGAAGGPRCTKPSSRCGSNTACRSARFSRST